MTKYMNSDKLLTLTVNRTSYSLPLIPGETLAELLRQRLGLTGTKIGCNEAECGACTVLVDGEPILSCSYPAGRAQGKEITTIEGLALLSSGVNETKEITPSPGCIYRLRSSAMWFLYPRADHDSLRVLETKSQPLPGGDSRCAERSFLPLWMLPSYRTCCCSCF